MSGFVFYDAAFLAKPETFEFDVWHDKFARSRMQAAPFASGQRYGSPALGAYLSVFEASALADDDIARLGPAGHEAISTQLQAPAREISVRPADGLMRGHLDTPLLYPVFFRVPPAHQAEFDAWYEEEHLGIMLRCRWWAMCRRFRVVTSNPNAPTDLALHYLTDVRALSSPERDEAKATPWRARLAQQDWFRGTYQLFYKLGPRLEGVG